MKPTRRKRRKNPDPATYAPQVGDRFSFTPPGMYPFDVVVTDVSSDKATVVRTEPGEAPGAYGVEMPAESVVHFVNDLMGRVYGKLSGNTVVDAVLDGSATFLGKGDDGLAFRVDTQEGPLVVKVSTTVPYQPFNPNHMTPAQAAARLEAQHAASEAMAQAGIPGILPSVFFRHGKGTFVRGFMVKPWVEIPDHFTREQLDAVAASVEAAHKTGWVFHDDIQVGLWNGEVYHFDIGKAEYVGIGKKSDPDDYWSDAYTDVQNLKRFFAKHGERYLTEREKINPIAEFEALYGVDARHLTPEQRKQYRGIVLRLGMKIQNYLKNHPDEDHGFWSEIPEYAEDEMRLMMEKFKDPPASRGNPARRVFMQDLGDLPFGTLVVSADGGTAWRKVENPIAPYSRKTFQRQRPSASSEDGWQSDGGSTVREFATLLRFMQREPGGAMWAVLP